MEALTDTSPDYVLSRWSMQDGLPSDRVRAVLQTRDGFVWVATFNGLARFDGVNFRVFNDANTPALRNRLVNRLHEDSAGRLWIGMDTGENTTAGTLNPHAEKGADYADHKDAGSPTTFIQFAHAVYLPAKNRPCSVVAHELGVIHAQGLCT